jgi:hypothetical protein
MATHPMPMMSDAAKENIVRRDMITVLPRLPKKRILWTIFETSCAREPQPAMAASRPGSLLR